MPSVMTLEGAGRRRFSLGAVKSTIGPRGRDLFGLGRFKRLGDAWSDDATATAAEERPIESMTMSFIGWGILTFAVATAAVRGRQAFDRWTR